MVSSVASDKTKSNALKLLQGKFKLDTRENFFPKRALKPQNRLPRAVVSPHLWRDLKGVYM